MKQKSVTFGGDHGITPHTGHYGLCPDVSSTLPGTGVVRDRLAQEPYDIANR
jgi:hypothetical protein